jgi:hypothetical protein
MEPRLDLTALSEALTKTRARWGSPAEARVRVRLHVVGKDALELAEVEVRKDEHAGAAWELLGYLEHVDGAKRMIEAWNAEQVEAREDEGATVRNDVRAMRALWKKP